MPHHSSTASPTQMWFLAYPPVKEKNPTWAPRDVYVFQHDATQLEKLDRTLPPVALLVTEANVRGQLMRSTLQHGLMPGDANGPSRLLIPVNVGDSFNTLATPQQHAQDVLALAARCPGLDLLIALPGPVLGGIYKEFGVPSRAAVEPYGVRQATYNAPRNRLAFKRVPKAAAVAMETQR